MNIPIVGLVSWLIGCQKEESKKKNCPKKKKTFISRAHIVKYSVGATKL